MSSAVAHAKHTSATYRFPPSFFLPFLLSFSLFFPPFFLISSLLSASPGAPSHSTASRPVPSLAARASPPCAPAGHPAAPHQEHQAGGRAHREPAPPRAGAVAARVQLSGVLT